MASASWNRDRRLDRLLGEDRELAKTLSAKQRRLRELDTALQAERHNLMSTIDRELALTIADRGYVLAHGETVLQGLADHLRTNHDLLISSYLGEQRLDDQRSPAEGLCGRETTP